MKASEIREMSPEERQQKLVDLKEEIFNWLDFMRIYMKPQGKKADMEEPMIVTRDSTVEMVCRTIHRDFVRNFRYAKVTGPSARFPEQKVGLHHILLDGDILTILIKK